jgi:pyruvate/2-oxoglutarate dehydrogenase complex dihydrolipoamide acyltransferase (E2) component
MTAASDLARMVPGFDFLQGLMKNAGAGLPNMGQWIAPTLNPEELEKRIQELKTVQFWLDQNAKLLGTTIQALEVQRMTLSTLQGMNLPMADLAESLKIKPQSMFAPKPAPAPEAEAEPEPSPAPRQAPARKAAAAAPAAKKGAAPAMDPVQWWGALTQQFTELAAQAMKDTGADAAKTLASNLVKQSVDTATGALKKAAAMPAQATAARKAAPKAVPKTKPKPKR